MCWCECVSNTLYSCNSQNEGLELSRRPTPSVGCSPPLPLPVWASCALQAFSCCRLPPVPVAVPLSTCYPLGLAVRTWPSCMCAPAAFPPCPWICLLGPGLVFMALPPWSLPSTPTPRSLFSFFLSFQKRGQLCSPLGDAPTSSNFECRKETGPPSEACQASRTLCYSGTSPWTEGDGGFSARPPTTSALPFRPRPASLWPDRTGALLFLAPHVDRGLPHPHPSLFDGVCDISCCEVKEGPLCPAPFSCSLLVRVSVFPLSVCPVSR